MQVDVARDLPEDLALPLERGEPWWYWLGGRPSLDLVNTLRERWRRRVDTLATPEDLVEWLVRSGVVQAPPGRVTRTTLGQARDLREAIDALVVAQLDGTPRDPAAVAELDGWLRVAGTRPHLALGDDGARVFGERTAEDSPRRALGQIALDAATMLGDPAEAARVRICASPTCSARFFDRSPAGARRWCSMRTCGNAAKARAHRERRRAAA
jgi:predicted RNA-binding Zn ribbon-like protein